MCYITPSSRLEWRSWLEKNGATASKVYLIYHKKHSGIPSILYREAVEEALCFGWIDSTVKRLDDIQYQQLFTPRKPKSTWSKLNKQLVEELRSKGLMTSFGEEKIQIAQENGSWDILNDCYNHIIPEDLATVMTVDLKTKFNKLSSSKKTEYLWLLKQKKMPDSRQKAIRYILSKL